MCSECGHYRGRLVIDVALKAAKKAEKQKAKERGRSAEESRKTEAETEEVKPLSPEGLSKK